MKKVRTAREIFDGLKNEGYDTEAIIYAMQDGEYLKNDRIDQDMAEKVHAMAKRKLKKEAAK